MEPIPLHFSSSQTLSDEDETHLLFCLRLRSNPGGRRASSGHWAQRLCSDTQSLSGQVGTQLQVMCSSHFLADPSDPRDWSKEEVSKKKGGALGCSPAASLKETLWAEFLGVGT